MSKKPTYRKNDSGEIDVFEAAGYYSEINDEVAYNKNLNASVSQRIYKEVHVGKGYMDKGERKTSLDSSIPMRYQVAAHDPRVDQPNQVITEQKKIHKQPSSPVKRLAQFLNSLFNQKIPKKKKKSPLSSSSTSKPPALENSDDDDDDETSPASLKRMSIGHFPPTTTQPIYSSTKSGLRTPTPLPAPPPRKESLVSSFQNYNGKTNNRQSAKPGVLLHERSVKASVNFNLLKEKSKHNIGANVLSKRLVRSKEPEKKGYKELISLVVDNGWDSDSSSDLFELQLDRGFVSCSSDLALNESTHIDRSTKPGAPMITTNVSDISRWKL